MNGFQRWVQLEDVFVCIPCKNGSSAFGMFAAGGRKEMWRTHKLHFSDALADYPDTRKLLSVRHPVDRFASLWRDKCRNRTEADKGRAALGRFFVDPADWTPDQLMDVIEQYPFGNKHYYPQITYYVPGCELVDYKSIYKVLGAAPPPPVHATAKYPEDPPMPVDRILAHYKQDLILWENRNE